MAASSVDDMVTTGFRLPDELRRASSPRRLDESQARVVGSPDGVSAAVIGAPGTGKTTTLIETLVDRVEGRGHGPRSVLVLTPARSTATRLRDVIAARLGVPTPGPMARTISSLAFDVVGHSALLAGAEPPTLLTGGDQDSIVRELLEGHEADGTGPRWPEHLGPQVRRLRGFRTELREMFMRATEQGLSPDDLRALAFHRPRPEWASVADLLDEYHRVVDGLSGRHLDSAELVAYAVAALDRGETAPVVEGLELVLVEDAHEATESTVSLLRALVRRGVAVIAFGDPDLSTNAFRGGSPDILGRLGPRLGVEGVETIFLSTAHRHDPALRDLVSRVTGRIGTAGAGRQHAAVAGSERVVGADDPAGDVPPIVTVRADSPAHEISSVARCCASTTW